MDYLLLDYITCERYLRRPVKPGKTIIETTEQRKSPQALKLVHSSLPPSLCCMYLEKTYPHLELSPCRNNAEWNGGLSDVVSCLGPVTYSLM